MVQLDSASLVNSTKSRDSNGKQTFFDKLSTGFFGFMYMLSKDMHMSPSRAIVSLMVQFCQMLYFCFDESIGFPWPPFMTSLASLLRVFSFGFYLNDLDTSTKASVMLVVLTLLATGVSLGIYVAQAFLKGAFKIPWTVAIQRVLASLCCTVLTLPVVTILLTATNCSNGTYMFGGSCGGIVHMLSATISWVLVIMFVVVVSAVDLLANERSPKSSSALASAQARVRVAARLAYIIVATVFMTMRSDQPQTHEQQHLLCAVLLLASGSSLGAYIYYIPHYYHRMNYAWVAVYSSLVWATACLWITVAVDNSGDTGSTMLLIGGLPFFVYFTCSVLKSRVAYLAGLDFEQISSPFLVEVKLRLKARCDAAKQKQTKKHTDSSTTLVCNKYINPQDWKAAMNTHKHSAFLRFHLSMLYGMCLEDDIMSGRHFRKASQLNKSFEHHFIMFKHHRALEENQAGGHRTTNAISYVAFEHHYVESRNKMMDVQKLQVEFWKVLFDTVNQYDHKPHNNGHYEALFELGAKVHKATTVCQQHLEKLLRVSGSSARALRLYAVFAGDVLNDTLLSQELMDKADAVEELHAASDDEVIDADGGFNAPQTLVSPKKRTDQVTMFSEKVPMCTISGEDENLGQIMAASKATCAMYGYSKSQLVGENIARLCPKPFDEFHDQFLRRYLDTGKPHILNKSRMVFGQHADGHVFAVSLTVTPSTSNDGRLMYLGQFKQIHSSHEFILTQTDGKIVAATEYLFKLLALTKEAIAESSVSLVEFLDQELLEVPVKDREVKLNLPYSPREGFDHTWYKVTKMPVQLKSDSENEPYDIQLLMFRLRKFSSVQSEQSRTTAGATMNMPLGFMESSAASPALPNQNSIDEIAKKNSTKVPVIPELEMDPTNVQTIATTNAQTIPATNAQTIATTNAQTIPKAQPNGDGPVLRNGDGAYPADAKPGQHLAPSSPRVLEPTASFKKRMNYVSPSDQAIGDERPTVKNNVRQPRTRTALRSPSMSGHGHDDKASVAASSMGFSRKENIHQFHRIIQARNQLPDPSITHLKKIFVIMIVNFSAIAIFTSAVVLMTFRTYAVMIANVDLSIQRSLYVSQIMSQVHAHLVVPNLELEYPLNVSTLENLVDGLQETHDHLAVAVNSPYHYSSAEEYAVPVVGTDLQVHTKNLWVSVLDYISNTNKVIAELESGEMSTGECTKSCRYIVENGPGSIENATVNFAIQIHDSAEEDLFSGQIYSFIGLGLVVLFLGFILVRGFQPVAIQILRNQNSVARAFTVIPRATIQTIMIDCMRKLQQNQNEDEEAEYDAESVGGKSTRSEKSKDMVLAEISDIVGYKPSARRAIGKSTPATASSTGQGKNKKVHPQGETPTRKKRSKNKSKVRRAKNFLLVLFATIWKMNLFILVIFAYFVGSVVFDQTVREWSLHLSHNCLASGMRLHRVSTLRYWVQVATSPVVDDVHGAIERVNSVIDELQEIDAELILGKHSDGPNRQLQPGYSMAEQLSLMFERGCLPEDCDRSFDAVKEGLHIGLLDYLEEIQNLALVQEQSLRVNSALNTTDIVYTMNKVLDPRVDALMRSLRYSADLYLEEAQNFQGFTVMVKSVMLLVFVLLMLILYLLIKRKFIARVENELKHTRAMLLMVPGEVFEKVPLMKEFIVQMKKGAY